MLLDVAEGVACGQGRIACVRSIKLCSSFTFGSRQSPATEPSLRPQEVLASVLAVKAFAQTLRIKTVGVLQPD